MTLPRAGKMAAGLPSIDSPYLPGLSPVHCKYIPAFFTFLFVMCSYNAEKITELIGLELNCILILAVLNMDLLLLWFFSRKEVIASLMIHF